MYSFFIVPILHDPFKDLSYTHKTISGAVCGCLVNRFFSCSCELSRSEDSYKAKGFE